MNLAESHLDVPYKERWEVLKPTILRIYLEEDATVEELAERMANVFSFKAEVHQYRYQFRKSKWDISKRAARAEKDDAITVLGKRRQQQGIGTSDVQLERGGWLKAVDEKQLKRYLNDTIRKQGSFSIRPGLFFSRNLPYSALIRKLGGHADDKPSPLSNGPRTPAYLAVSSPQGQRASASPKEGMSPTTHYVHKVLMDRAQLLLGGRDLDLMKQMSRDERRATADWLHDFWLFAFVTTKYWGKGPKNWTLPLINLKTLAGVIDDSTGHQPIGSQELVFAQPMVTGVIDSPTQLCDWSIHVDYDIDYEPIDSQPSSPASDNEDQSDIEDESTWREWNDQQPRDLTNTLIQSLRDNTFTRYQAKDVPLAIDQIINTVSGSMKDATVEAIGFAIITRNVPALSQLLNKQHFNREALRGISPFHLAARFLDGSKVCCGVMWQLLSVLHEEMSIGMNYTDNLGFTVLDMLFMSILRSHSSVSSSSLGTEFSTTGSNFGGVDVDICGRWDADSPCVRHLHADGRTNIPPEWKHVFCHTSAQAVCHSLTAIFMEFWAPDINTRSGLFQRRCRCCGLELKLGPLHSFVVVCFHLATAGRPGETLFGMLACLVCLLTLRADPCLSVEVSLPAILEIEETEECRHQAFNAAELASAVPSTVINAWTLEVKLGWEAIKEVLNHCVRRSQSTTIDIAEASLNISTHLDDVEYHRLACSVVTPGVGSDSESCPHQIHKMERMDGVPYIKCGDKRLGTIWAALQVELLTYRRLRVGDPWLSSKFGMRDVVEGLRASDDSVLMRLVKSRGEDAFQWFTTCGLFLPAEEFPGCPKREEACATYFANLDDWKRTTFIPGRATYQGERGFWTTSH